MVDQMFWTNFKSSTNCTAPTICDEIPLDLSIKSRALKRTLYPQKVSSQSHATQSVPSAFSKPQKRLHVCNRSYQFEKTSVEWAIPEPSAPKLSRQTNVPEASKEPTEVITGRFDKIAPHLGYNAAQEGLQKAAEHLKKCAGQTLQAFLKAAYCFEQAAVSAASLKADSDAREYLGKATASRSIARMAENLALLEKIVAEGFLRDAEGMHARCKLDDILRTRSQQETTEE